LCTPKCIPAKKSRAKQPHSSQRTSMHNHLISKRLQRIAKRSQSGQKPSILRVKQPLYH
jgi:hypothetical protein